MDALIRLQEAAAQPGPGLAWQVSGDRPAVWAAGVSKSYGPTAALAGLDLCVAAGETLALLGPNFWAQIHAFAGRGRTVLFATHYLQEADDAADRIVVIAGGRKIADGPPAAIKADFGDQQVRFTLIQGSPAELGALDGVRAVERDHARVTLHSSDTDATVTSLLASGLAWSGLEVGGLDLETSFLRLLGEQS